MHSPSKPPLLTLINPSDLNDNINHYDDELYRKDPLFVRSKERQLQEAKQRNLKHNKYLDVDINILEYPLHNNIIQDSDLTAISIMMS